MMTINSVACMAYVAAAPASALYYGDLSLQPISLLMAARACGCTPPLTPVYALTLCNSPRYIFMNSWVAFCTDMPA